jgi:hypothetical protein
MGFNDGDLVTERKAIYYLQNKIIADGNPRKKLADGSNAPYAFETISMIVKALNDIFGQQLVDGNNVQENSPRGSIMRRFLVEYRLGETQRKRDAYEDRHRNTLNDGYKKDQLQEVAEFFLQKDTIQDLRNRADVLVGYCILSRSQSMRYIEFADMFSLEMPNEGPTPCHALVIIMNRGKTNRGGKIEYGAMMRNKNVHKCPIGAVALYLFSRFHLEGEDFPDFSTRQAW